MPRSARRLRQRHARLREHPGRGPGGQSRNILVGEIPTSGPRSRQVASAQAHYAAGRSSRSILQILKCVYGLPGRRALPLAPCEPAAAAARTRRPRAGAGSSTGWIAPRASERSESSGGVAQGIPAHNLRDRPIAASLLVDHTVGSNTPGPEAPGSVEEWRWQRPR